MIAAAFKLVSMLILAFISQPHLLFVIYVILKSCHCTFPLGFFTLCCHSSLWHPAVVLKEMVSSWYIATVILTCKDWLQPHPAHSSHQTADLYPNSHRVMIIPFSVEKVFFETSSCGPKTSQKRWASECYVSLSSLAFLVELGAPFCHPSSFIIQALMVSRYLLVLCDLWRSETSTDSSYIMDPLQWWRRAVELRPIHKTRQANRKTGAGSAFVDI